MSQVVVLAGGQWQLPIVKYLQSKNHFVHVVNPHVTETTKAANNHIILDVCNVKDVIIELSKIKPEFVTSDQSDIAVAPVALVSSALGTIGNDVASSFLFCNKAFMASFAREKTIPIPVTGLVQGSEDVKEFARRNDGPYVLKPVDANASRGFVYLDNLEDIESKVEYTMSYSRVKRAVVQQYVKGVGIIMDGICSGGKHRTLTHAIKNYFREGVISGVTYPSGINPSILANIVECNDRFVELSGLSFGITHAEYIVDVKTGLFWLIEIAARGGGFGISSDIVPHITGINLYDILYKDLQGQSTDVTMLKPLNRAAKIKFYEYQKGKVVDIQGEEEARSIPGVRDFRIAVKVGQDIVEAKDGGSRHAHAVLLGTNKAEVSKAEHMINQKIKVEVK